MEDYFDYFSGTVSDRLSKVDEKLSPKPAEATPPQYAAIGTGMEASQHPEIGEGGEILEENQDETIKVEIKNISKGTEEDQGIFGKISLENDEQ